VSLSSRPCFRRWAAPNRQTLLYERPRAEIRILCQPVNQ
jgi:hypothetical protein